MSKEVIDELITYMGECDKSELSEYIEEMLVLSLIEDTDLAELLDIEIEDLDELISGDVELTDKKFRTYKNRLVNFLKKEKRYYERVYYKEKK